MHTFLKYLGNTLIVSGVAYILIGFYPVIRSEMWYWYHSSFQTQWQKDSQNKVVQNDIEALNIGDYDYSIIIPMINVNSPIIENVSTTNEEEYNTALKNGVAQATNTNPPGTQPGNTYLFAHSTPNIFDIQKYDATFTLLNKLKTGDRVTIVYKEKLYIYEVFSNEVVPAFDLEPLERSSDIPLLTLQTCDPPGIPINRRIVTARLVETEDLISIN